MSLLHLIFVALVWRTAAAAPPGAGKLTFKEATQTTITMTIGDAGANFQSSPVTYAVARSGGTPEIFAAAELSAETDVTDDKEPALTAATMVTYTITTASGAENTPIDFKFCTAPEALKSVTEAKDADGTTLVLTVVTGEGKTTGVYIDDLSTALTDSPTVASEDGTDVGAASDEGSGKKWQLKFKTEAAASGTYKVTMPKFPDPAPTYTVKPYYNDATGPCVADAIGVAYSVANKVSLEGMFVYGVVGLMALILRALGLESYGLF